MLRRVDLAHQLRMTSRSRLEEPEGCEERDGAEEGTERRAVPQRASVCVLGGGSVDHGLEEQGKQAASRLSERRRRERISPVRSQGKRAQI